MAQDPRRRMLRSMDPRHLSIELDTTQDPIAGIATAGGARRAFRGWLGLLGALDALIAVDGSAGSHDDTPGRPAMTTTRIDTTSADTVAALRERIDEVLAPGDEGWDQARQAWNLTAVQHPAAIVLPHDAGEVAATLTVAARAGLRVAPQGTGHGASPLGDLSASILLRTDRMRDVLVDPIARKARVGAGALWEDVVPQAGEHGLVALHGSSPNVGVVGYSLGGGIGWLARSKGIAANSVTAIELVTPAGEFIRADERHEADLFWALRGGGGNFGVVTAMEFALYPLETVHAGWLIWPWLEAERVLTAWTEWIRDVPEEMTSIGRILQIPDAPFAPEPLRGKAIVVVELAYAGDEETGRELVRPLRALGPMMDTVAQIPAAEMMRLHQDPEPPMPGVGGHAMLDEVGPEAVRRFVELVGPGSGSHMISSEIRHLGGAAGRPAPGGGALSHMEGEFALFALGVPMDPSQIAPLQAEANAVAEGMRAFGRGRMYANFTEERAAAGDFHPEERLARLRAAQRRVDPHGRMQAMHGLEG